MSTAPKEKPGKMSKNRKRRMKKQLRRKQQLLEEQLEHMEELDKNIEEKVQESKVYRVRVGLIGISVVSKMTYAM